MNSKNHYEVLKVHKHASADQIKESYRRLAREYHPDKNPNHNDEFKEISAAYDVLSDPNKRRDFDQQQAAKRRVPAPEPSEMFNFGYPDLFQHHFDVFDHILNNFARTTPHFHRHRNSHFDDLFFGFHSFGFNHNRPRREYTQGQAHRSHAHGSTHANIPASHMYRRPHSPTQPSRSSQKNASKSERPTRVRIWPRTEEPKKSEEEKEPEVITIDENEDLVSDEMEPEIEVITIDSDEEDTIIVDE